jgi:hypothetical protein
LTIKKRDIADLPSRKEGGYGIEAERELANLALFLCTLQGEGIKGALFGMDGSYTAF